MAQQDEGGGGNVTPPPDNTPPPDPVQPDTTAPQHDPLEDIHAKLDEIRALLQESNDRSVDQQANHDDASDREPQRGPGNASPIPVSGPLDARDGGSLPPPTPVPPPDPTQGGEAPYPGGFEQPHDLPPGSYGPPIILAGGSYPQTGPFDARDAGVLPPRPAVGAPAQPGPAGQPGATPAQATNPLGGFNPNDPNDQAWYHAFTIAHQGMTPDAYYSQPNNAKPGMTPMQAAMDDRGWGNQLAAGRAAHYGAGGNAIVNNADWMQHYQAGGANHGFVPYSPANVNAYAGNLRGGGGGGGGGAPSNGGAPSWWTPEVEAAWQEALKKK